MSVHDCATCTCGPRPRGVACPFCTSGHIIQGIPGLGTKTRRCSHCNATGHITSARGTLNRWWIDNHKIHVDVPTGGKVPLRHARGRHFDHGNNITADIEAYLFNVETHISIIDADDTNDPPLPKYTCSTCGTFNDRYSLDDKCTACTPATSEVGT